MKLHLVKWGRNKTLCDKYRYHVSQVYPFVTRLAFTLLNQTDHICRSCLEAYITEYYAKQLDQNAKVRRAKKKKEDNRGI